MSPGVRELTARGRGAIRVLELRGPDALAAVRRLAPAAPARGLACLALRDARGELLDEALVLVDSPERVELHLHGAPALVERLRHELGLRSGPADAPPTLEARAEALLAGAASEAAARVLLDQAEGALRGAFEELLRASDEELALAAARLARRGRVALSLVTPPRVVLVGPVNAGKSTLFNALVGRERVVVDPAAGTTRDAVRERVLLGAFAIELYDTAGERDEVPAGEVGRIEREGQELMRSLRASADLVVRLCPLGAGAPPEVGPGEILLASRADEAAPGTRVPWPSLSAFADPQGARQLVERQVLDRLGLPEAPWTPGAGAPFEPAWVEALERLAPAELRARVRGWLEAGRTD